MFKSLEITELGSAQAENLSKLLLASDKNYTKYFIPFSFDEKSIKGILERATNDKYFGVFISNELVGFYMLRGFDDGYVIPSYGTWIAEQFSSLGLSKLTLQHAISYCKVNGIKKIMLKVHPDNSIAKKTYENYGFKQEGTDAKNNNLIYYKDLN
jgi:ribosomal-protein-alanine N-acetyltransferase